MLRFGNRLGKVEGALWRKNRRNSFRKASVDKRYGKRRTLRFGKTWGKVEGALCRKNRGNSSRKASVEKRHGKRQTVRMGNRLGKVEGALWRKKRGNSLRKASAFSQNSNWSGPEKWSTSKGGPVFSKLFRLDRTDPLSFGPKCQEILVEWIAPMIYSVPQLPQSRYHPIIITFLCSQSTIDKTYLKTILFFI